MVAGQAMTDVAGSGEMFRWWASHRPPDRAGLRWRGESMILSRHPLAATGEVVVLVVVDVVAVVRSHSGQLVGRTGLGQERPLRRL